jgi:hypothetical protein
MRQPVWVLIGSLFLCWACSRDRQVAPESPASQPAAAETRSQSAAELEDPVKIGALHGLEELISRCARADKAAEVFETSVAGLAEAQNQGKQLAPGEYQMELEGDEALKLQTLSEAASSAEAQAMEGAATLFDYNPVFRNAVEAAIGKLAPDINIDTIVSDELDYCQPELLDGIRQGLERR